MQNELAVTARHRRTPAGHPSLAHAEPFDQTQQPSLGEELQTAVTVQSSPQTLFLLAPLLAKMQ